MISFFLRKINKTIIDCYCFIAYNNLVIIKNNKRRHVMNCLYQTKRISKLKEKMLSSKRYASIEQARIITRVYQENEDLSIPKKEPYL